MTSGNNEINAALLDIWCEIALPYEDELEDCFNSIKEQCKLTGDEIMNGDGVLVRHTKGGYIIRTMRVSILFFLESVIRESMISVGQE